MGHRAIWSALPCLVALCCTVEDRPLELVGIGAGAGGNAPAAGSGQGATTTDAGEGNQAGEAGASATSGSSAGGSAAGGTATGGTATGGTATGGTSVAGGSTMGEGGVGELPEGQGTDCTLPSPSCFAALAPTVGGDALIDDFEDGDLCAKQHLRGYWFPFGAGEYHMSIANEGHSSSRSLQLSGNEHAAVAVRPNGAHVCDEQAFDLSSYTGIKFWAKVVTGNVEVNIAARDAGTDPGGGEFATTVSSPPVVLTKSWQQLTVPFSSMKDSNQRLFDPSTTIILKLQAPTVDPPAFVLLFDDVTFY